MLNKSKEDAYTNKKELLLKLKEEQLDIYKSWIITGEVATHTETLTEEKKITVSTTREELVIEKKSLDGKKETTEILRIPVKEEQIEIVKHPVILQDVSIYNHQYQDTKHIETALKKEVLHIETSGQPIIIDKQL
ncbi:MAG: YsnF/AvaK domain-containing protein [Bacillota bacterium]|nr:YsnF/AvaK domain-containing protein [Bacillota bacterium]